MPFAILLVCVLQSASVTVDPGPQTPPDAPRDAVWGELTPMAEVLDDAIPLPIPEQWEEGPEGDVFVAPASGDPFFLGFSTGAYYPPANERVDPQLAVTAWNTPADGRPASETYGFVMFSKRMTDERFQALRDLGARVLEFHPFYTVKIALPAESLEQVGALDFVRWVGAVRPWQKIDAEVLSAISRLSPGERVPLFVNVFESDLCADSTETPVGSVEESDGESGALGNPRGRARITLSNGWQHKRLERLGATILEYVPSIAALRVELDPAHLEELVGLDFVQFIEADLPGSFAHDESMAMINADRTRSSYDGSTNGAAVVAVLDSGAYLAHAAIDPWTVGWDFTTEGAGAFTDGCEHGTHVIGTVLGNGDVEDSYQGAAPGLGFSQSRRFYSGKMGQSSCSLSYSFGAMTSAMHTQYTDTSGNTSPIPMAVSCSWGNQTSAAYGSDVNARTWDAEVWSYNQQYIFANGNWGPTPGVIGQQAAAKNILAVGSVRDYYTSAQDPGFPASNTSRGPTADGRWKPNLCAPGTSIRSTKANSTNLYVTKSGTSMATPHVTGIAAQLCDHYSFLRYNPATLCAVMMAGAITKDDSLLTSPGVSAPHLNVHGTGRVDAYKAHWGDSQQALYFWGVTLGSSSSTFVDFPISAGATRVTMVMHYKETAASSGASQALINNYDMYIDASPFSAGNNTGEYTVQRSSLDNTEVRILNNPLATTWRIKIYPTSTVSGGSAKVGICAIVTYGDTTPTPSYNVVANNSYVRPNDPVTITASYYNPFYIASAVFLDSAAIGATYLASYNTMADGSSADLMDNAHAGRDVTVGNVVHNTSRVHRWSVRWASEGAKTFTVGARSDNATNVSDDVTVYVDGTPPPLPTGVHSTTHTPGVWTNDTTITYSWTQPADNVSGVDGYGIYTASGGPGSPSQIKDIEQVTSYNETLTQGSWYFCLSPVDNSGNWNTGFANAGPFRIDTTAPSAASGLTSSTHQAGVQSCSTQVTMNWTPATDAGGSGLGGYISVWSTAPVFVPTIGTSHLPGATSYSANIGSSSSPRYFHLRSFDAAGNLGATAHFGPILANAAPITVYCTAKLNSLGCLPSITSNGSSPSKGSGAFAVQCSQVLNQKNGLLFFGFEPLSTPFQGGTLCVASPTIRTPNQSSGGSVGGNDCTGSYSFTFTTAYMNQANLDPGDVVYAQYWMRDPQSASTTGLSNALRFVVCN